VTSAQQDASLKETRYWDRTDTVAEKVRLLEAALKNGKFEVAESLADSIKHTVTLAKQREQNPGEPVLKTAETTRSHPLP